MAKKKDKKEFQEALKTPDYVYGEVATRVLDTLYKEFDSNFTIEDMKKMMKDLDISGAVNTLKRSICAKELNVVPYNEVNREKVNEIESRLNFVKLNDLLNNIVESKFYGYSVSEIVFDENWNYVVKPKNRELFDFDKEAKQWYYKNESDKVYIEDSKFLVSVNNSYKAYKGESILYELFQDYQIKKDLDKKLGGIINRYGDRITWFLYNDNTDPKDVQEQANNLKKANSGMVIAIPGSTQSEYNKQFGFITLNDLKTEIHQALLTRYEKKIDKYILGNTLAQNEGDSGRGSYAQAQTHAQQQEIVITDLATYVEEELRKILKVDGDIYAYDINDYYLKLSDKIDIDEEIEREKKRKDNEKLHAEIINTKMDVISKMSQTGYKISLDEMKEFTGFKTLTQVAKQVPEFALKSDKKGVARELRGKYEESFNKLNVDTVVVKSFEDIENISIDLSRLENDFILGVLQGYANVGKAISEFEETLNPFNMKFDDAIKYFIDVERVGYDFINEVQSEVYDNFRYILDNTNLEVQLKLLNNIQKNLLVGGTFDEWLKNSKNEIEKIGLGKSGSYFETVYRTNMQTAYSVGQYKAQTKIKDSHPYWLYDGVIDGREQDHTRRYDGKIWKATDPIWNSIYPPNDYNCRCNVIPITKDDLEEMGEDIQNPSKKMQEDAKELLGKFAVNPAKNYFEGIKKIAKDKKDVVEKLKKTIEWSIIELDDINKLDNLKRKDITKFLLKERSLEANVSVRKIKEYGTTEFRNGRLSEVALRSDDVRTNESRLKTIFHEVTHATAKEWSNILTHTLEETYAETIGNYLVGKNGFNVKNISVSYMNILPNAFEELRKIEKFSNLKTIEEFGETLEELGREEIKKLNVTVKKLGFSDFIRHLDKYTKEEMLEKDVLDNFYDVQFSMYPQYREGIKLKFEGFINGDPYTDSIILERILAALYKVKGVR